MFLRQHNSDANYAIVDKYADAMLDPSSPVRMPKYVSIPLEFTFKSGTEISLLIDVQREWFEGSFIPFVTNYGKTFSFQEEDNQITIVHADKSQVKAWFLPQKIQEAHYDIMEQIREEQQNELQEQRVKNTGCCDICYETSSKYSEFRRSALNCAVCYPDSDSGDSMW